jgi:Xaa-Pro aminopeptidase
MELNRRAAFALGGAGLICGMGGGQAMAASGAKVPNGNDAFPMFSDAEMARRLAAVQAEMVKRDLGGLLLYGHTGIGNSVGQVNVQYLARYAAVFETYLVVPTSGEPTLFLGVPYHIPNALAISSVQDIRWGDSLGNAVARLKDLKLDTGKIGIVGPGAAAGGLTMFVESRARLGAQLPNATFENATNWFDAFRLIKSDEELALLRMAGDATDRVHEHIFQLTKAGTNARDLRRAMDVMAAREGLTFPFGHISAISMADPGGFYPDFYPTDAKIERGSMVMTEFCLGYGNYWGKIWGSFFVGEPTAEYRKMFEVAAQVHDNLVVGVKPGMTGKDIDPFLAPITAAGLEQPANVLVGGWSAMNHAPQMGALPMSLSLPFTPPFRDTPLLPRQTVTLQAWVSMPGTQKGLWVGSSGAITETGYESFNRYPVSKLRVR